MATCIGDKNGNYDSIKDKTNGGYDSMGDRKNGNFLEFDRRLASIGDSRNDLHNETFPLVSIYRSQVCDMNGSS